MRRCTVRKAGSGWRAPAASSRLHLLGHLVEEHHEADEALQRGDPPLVQLLQRALPQHELLGGELGELLVVGHPDSDEGLREWLDRDGGLAEHGRPLVWPAGRTNVAPVPGPVWG